MDDEARHMAIITSIKNRIQEIFNRFSLNVGRPLSKLKLSERRGVWSGNKMIELELERLLRQFGSQYRELLDQLVREAWERSEAKNDKMIMDLVKGAGLVIGGRMLLDLFNRDRGKVDLDEVTIESVLALPRRAEGLAAFLRDFNLRLSPRVWELTRENKKIITKYLDQGLASGRSAPKISQDVRECLKNPDKRFRRLRDPETGKLKLSRPAAAYHPGQGVYRSSYKNALRMARTEVNMAYRSSDMYRWKNTDFILGYEVLLSGSHTVTDICDDMVGKYPKTFVFTGWHTACFCRAVPILPSQDQFVRYLEKGSIGKKSFKTRIPGRAHSYIQRHQDKILALKTRPFWVTDNFTIKDNRLTPKNKF